ncbi:uncharacterized protein DNG_06750 [Cephalotrichum gorgonifer]|uniref:Uncharacterized protein n=1 Tax=Cephalotrichum gorgonifer TaxID=2041049 RepID=A0AAE8SXL7_9PEZI|nr:uncharacterized protein DNG_06750 [Cephalotrichum gorgonifer]
MATASTNSSYLLRTPFNIPSEWGNRWAVAFGSDDSSIMIAALSVIVGLSTVLLWNLISFVGKYWSVKRKLTLATIWNSNDAWSAFKGEHTHPEPPSDDREKSAAKTRTESTAEDGTGTRSKGDFWYGLFFCVSAFAVFAGGIAIGIVAPSLILIGAVAPVKTSLVYYPRPPEQEVAAEVIQEFGLRAPGAMRSLGHVDAVMDILRSQVLIQVDTSHQAIGEDRVVSLKYIYYISGLEMGLRHGDRLCLRVEGFCITEYGWRNETEDADDVMDLYDMWGNPDQQNRVLLNENEIFHAPSATFIIRDDPENVGTSTSNMTYAVLVHSAHRSSITSGGDPW